LAARFVRDEEAAGSNPATPTTKPQVTRYPVTCGLRNREARGQAIAVSIHGAVNWL
jgi:hypothetical protein